MSYVSKTNICWGLLATKTGYLPELAKVCQFSSLKHAIDGWNCSLPKLLNQSFRYIDSFLTFSSRKSLKIILMTDRAVADYFLVNVIMCTTSYPCWVARVEHFLSLRLEMKWTFFRVGGHRWIVSIAMNGLKRHYG